MSKTAADPRHYDVILSPVVTEKATTASEHNQVVFRVARGATKPEIKDAVEKLFNVKVKGVNTIGRQGQDEILSWPRRCAQRREKSNRDPRRGPLHRHHHRTLRRGRETIMALKNIQAGHAGSAPAGPRRPLGHLEGQAGQGPDYG
jgi:ribosomal protein L23